MLDAKKIATKRLLVVSVLYIIITALFAVLGSSWLPTVSEGLQPTVGGIIGATVGIIVCAGMWVAVGKKWVDAAEDEIVEGLNATIENRHMDKAQDMLIMKMRECSKTRAADLKTAGTNSIAADTAEKVFLGCSAAADNAANEKCLEEHRSDAYCNENYPLTPVAAPTATGYRSPREQYRRR
jgi:hypothetical protein